MHAAEDDVTSVRLGGYFGKLVRIPRVIGKANYFVALIMMSEDHAIASELATSFGDAIIHGVIGEDEIIIQRAQGSFCSYAHSIFRLQSRHNCRLSTSAELLETGMLKAIRRLQ